MQFHFHQHLCQSGILLCGLVFFISALAVVFAESDGIAGTIIHNFK
jgi:hypothetical protein